MTKMQKLFRKGAASLFAQGKLDKDQTHNYFMSGKFIRNAHGIVIKNLPENFTIFSH